MEQNNTQFKVHSLLKYFSQWRSTEGLNISEKTEHNKYFELVSFRKPSDWMAKLG